jgi:glycosyltransferase involved in cell wall biosynthesis
MPKPLITVLTVNYNTSDFIELMLYSFSKLTVNPYEVIICDNGSKNKDISKLKMLTQKNDHVELFFRKQTKSGSIAHAEALDLLIEKVDTKYTVIMDSDCVFLLKNWDEILIKNIDNKTKITGSTSPENRRGNRIGGGNFPLPFAVLFETKVYKELNISCLPDDKIKGQDTCWQWEPGFISNGFRGKTFITRNTRDFKQGPFADLTGVEDFFTDEGELIASHFGRGSSSGAGKYFKQFKIPIISGCLRRCCGRIEKRKWIAKCYEIINEQSENCIKGK